MFKLGAVSLSIKFSIEVTTPMFRGIVFSMNKIFAPISPVILVVSRSGLRPSNAI